MTKVMMHVCLILIGVYLSCRNMTRPAILKTAGLIIEPIRYSKPLTEAAMKGNTGGKKRAVNIVAGGKNKPGKN